MDDNYFLTPNHRLNNSTSTIELNSEVGSFLVLYAFRYAIGRRTYAIDDLNNFLRLQFPHLNPVIGKMILKEIQSELELNRRISEISPLSPRDLSSWERTLKLLLNHPLN